MYAIVTLAAALTPPESKNISNVSPSRKLKKINNIRLFLMG
jgi:hypothetical protein